MSAQDDVAALLRAVGKGGTVDERVRVLVAKLQQTLQGMKMNVADPNALTAIDGVVAALADNREAIVAAVAGHQGGVSTQLPAVQTVPEWFTNAEPEKLTEATRPEPEPVEEPVPAVVHRSKAKLKLPAKRARR